MMSSPVLRSTSRDPRNPAETVHSVFTAQVKRTPDAVAVEYGSQQLTYQELAQRSDLLAQQLARAGVAHGDIVAVLLPRSLNGIVALLGILKSGAAFLPLDEAYPAERLRFMLDDAGAKHVVTDGAHALLPVLAGVQVVLVDVSGTNIAEVASHELPTAAGMDLAYVMYTSGSTGKPKGVEIPHAAILRLVCPATFARVDAATVFLHAAPLSFDASTLEIWGPLLNGGRCVVHDEILPSGAGLAATISRHGVTSAWLTAALFNAVVDDNPQHLVGLQQLLIGGEALSVPHVRRAHASLPAVEIINGYGPTECTTFAATYPIPRALPADLGSVPIGGPIGETSLHVLDEALQPVPTGAVGELFIGGNGLARGYHDREELTRERFVAVNVTVEGSTHVARLYRTGDLVTVRADGNIEFLGRADQQVKIRGFRIETGEIESALAQHTSVRSCAVLAREDRPGDRRLVAYIVFDDAADTSKDVGALREDLARRLPEYMQPSAFVVLTALPITPNGKLDRRALPAPEARRPELANPYKAPGSARQTQVCTVFADVLGLDRVGLEDNFFELGGNSLLALQAIAALRSVAQIEVSTTTFLQNPTPGAIADVGSAIGAPTVSRTRRPARSVQNLSGREPVAVIGMAGRFPGAADVGELWKNLCAGTESITFFRDHELDASIPAALRSDPAYVRARGVFADVEMFDAGLFGINPKEAELMDPQQRKFLEICWECLEHGGYAPDANAGLVGVFAGMYNATYFQRHVQHRPDLIERVGEFQVMLANEKDYIATRVAHRLNLTGPAISIHTACSTSLVAISQAFDSLRSGQCDMALAGGIAITCPPNSGYLSQEGTMLSPDGHTRSFDADAQGTVFSDGAAVVLLKRLSDAIADEDTIYAVIRGTAVNNDGSLKASFTAPSANAQAAVVTHAQESAGVEPRDVSYIEAHGTATPLGDPIELEALTQAFRRGTADVGFCGIGSVKSNFGHLVIAAGATGLIKTALALKHQVIPPSINYRAPNPKIDFAHTPFVVNDRLAAWNAPAGKPRIAGVSAFGVGGTNAHAVLEEAPMLPSRPTSLGGPQLLLVSARTETALNDSAGRLAEFLTNAARSETAFHGQSVELRDVAHTLRVGRKTFAQRGFVVAESVQAAASALASKDASRFVVHATGATGRDVVFMFPGQGSQYAGMGRGLHESNDAFRVAFDECAELLASEVGFDLRQRVFLGTAEDLTPTAVAQPATFALEYSLAQFWLSRGLRPTAFIGHSVGEFVAAVLAGVMSLADALRLVARRGRLMQAQPQGSMLSIRLPADQVSARLPTGLSIAAENSPQITVVAGPTSDIEAFLTRLTADNVLARVLQTSHAFHSAMMEPVVAPFEAEVSRVRLSAPVLPIVSTLTGQWLTAEQATDARYWARHLREPVKFSPALRVLAETQNRVLLEVGPRTTLTTLARQHFTPSRPRPEVFPTFQDSVETEARAVLTAVGQLWGCGIDVDTSPLHGNDRARRIPLPTYPFERRRFWVEARAPAAAEMVSVSVTAHPVLPHLIVPEIPMSAPQPVASPSASRREQIIARLRTLFEDVAGADLEDADPSSLFVELGLDSLALTQVSLQLQKAFGVKVTFRQVMESFPTLARLSEHLDASMPPDVVEASPPAPAVGAPAAPSPYGQATAASFAQPLAGGAVAPTSYVQQVIEQQMRLMAQQLALLGAQGGALPPSSMPPAAGAWNSTANTLSTSGSPAMGSNIAAAQAQGAVPGVPGTGARSANTPAGAPAATPGSPPADDEASVIHSKYDVKKAFGAIARIHTKTNTELTDRQKARLETFMRRYIAKTKASKDYTTQHRPHLADPRVVNGFRPQLKEIIYQLVVNKSQGSHVWDIDGNEYIDALNGFGMSLFGWQPKFVADAVRKQLDDGYEIGPQHPLAGEVAKLICEMTGFDRAGLCNTGSEAVMGALRIARTVTGRTRIALFTGAYHGIFDEVIVRGTRKLRAVPAAPGIMPNTSENVLVLDYGTPEALEILRAQADDLAAVLIEPVQSRRPDFQPIEFLKELREITRKSGTLFIFDEVVTGFRSHPRGAQHVLGIDADLASYGKVVGGGFPIGVIAGKREYMDALDGGAWQYGDDSIPTVGVTYFAGTFVRHPLALAAAKAVLEHLKEAGPALQEKLTARTTQMVDELNAFFIETGAPIVVKNFASVWKTSFLEEHPLQDLLFAMMRNRGIHILDNFPCFFTTAHGEADFVAITHAYKESVRELQESDFLPRKAPPPRALFDASKPPVAGARLGRDVDGKPAWFVPNAEAPGKYLKVNG